jgi:type 1 glutamine amidotransferase/nicotinamidase-related amidase
MNNVISIAREKGILIVHAPSGSMTNYKNNSARKFAEKYDNKKLKDLISSDLLDSEKNAIWPIDQPDSGCDCSPECIQNRTDLKNSLQIDALEIKNQDAISNSGTEIGGLFRKQGIRNVVLMGASTNMNIIGSSYGLRNMVRLGMNVVLMRDLTDAIYDSKQFPGVNHFTGNSLIAEYIETYVCPTIVSSVFIGEKQFRFKNDKRPIIAFVIAENEYQTYRTLPEFAHELLLKKSMNCEFALGKEEYKEPYLHNIENLQILKDADLVLVSVRRRALPTEQMNLIKEYTKSGNPLLGIRTASHAFSTGQAEPRTGGNSVGIAGQDPEPIAQWPEFDKDVLGGNYTGHYPNLKTGIGYRVVPGMENHPVFKGISSIDFIGPVAVNESLYENRPLSSENVQVLLLGAIPEKPEEPVMWINNRKKGKVIYTSLGHWDHWKIETFRQIMFNTVDYLLKK